MSKGKDVWGRQAEVEGARSAYPRTISVGEIMKIEGGLTKRELIAAIALGGAMANSIPGSHHQTYAVDAVREADALLAELARTEPKPAPAAPGACL